ncbi:MAG: UDP-N-acetylmuramate:L-alanyl-gamma-D-glutamyl-meso-diaminopimelate ligase [Desulfamplus sp.]|nr:UDP-N-acetylmuramate:L-alanyl-gamma-D-glutamyl-meso-diaminopimelate ligase [Desulfamplus sp.]
MDLKLNFIPLNAKKIHIIAACGTGMGALSCMLQDMGFEVTGSDQNIYPPMSDFLAQKGVKLFKGFSPSNLDSLPDLVVIGNAVTKNNVEAVAVMEKNIPYCSMPQALNHFIAQNKKILLITGTHGKTTTSSILAHILNEAGLDPSFMIGGIVKGFGSNYRIGKGDYMVIEGDEYDTAFFDKGAKFMHYTPDVAVITSIEFDHADIFHDIDQIKSAFMKFVEKIPQKSLIIASGNDKNIRDIIDSALCNVQYYGDDLCYDWSFSNLQFDQTCTKFEVRDCANIDKIIKITTPLMGRHNAMNALAVYGVSQNIGIDDKTILKAFSSFEGVKRRQEIRGVKRGITVMDDFAHHPSAVRETILGVKPFFKDGRLIAVFEPRTNSSMRDIFQNDYPQSFDGADIVCIREPSMLFKVPEDRRMNSRQLVDDIAKRGINALYFDNTENIIELLAAQAKSGDLILIMSNGGFDNIHQRLLEKL